MRVPTYTLVLLYIYTIQCDVYDIRRRRRCAAYTIFFLLAASRRHKECDYITHTHEVYHARFHLISFAVQSACGWARVSRVYCRYIHHVHASRALHNTHIPTYYYYYYYHTRRKYTDRAVYIGVWALCAAKIGSLGACVRRHIFITWAYKKKMKKKRGKCRRKVV